jgi:hypothetical protein
MRRPTLKGSVFPERVFDVSFTLRFPFTLLWR